MVQEACRAHFLRHHSVKVAADTLNAAQKEERTHDEKIASANQKIKQAGQLYERRAKKSPRDATEEHTKYMNLLSTLGPEVNREK